MECLRLLRPDLQQGAAAEGIDMDVSLTIETDDGRLLPLEQMSADVRACIASMDFDPNTGRVTKVRFWDKNAALEKAMRHHGLYEKDNSQKGESVKVQVLLVGPQ